MNPETGKMLQRKVSELGSLPVMPAILQSLGTCLSASPADLDIARIVELISYDKSLAAQCLRVANSAMFARQAGVESIRQALLALGMQRVRDIVYSCSLPKLFAGAQQGMAQATFWRHALGTALVTSIWGTADGSQYRKAVSRRTAARHRDTGELSAISGRISASSGAGGNFRDPAGEVEQDVLGFTHCDSGRVLADIWKLPPDISETIEFHHCPSSERPGAEMTSVVYLADLLCRLRGLGYGYYEAREFDLAAEVPWQVLQKNHPDAAAGLDLARFTFELDQYGVEVQTMVDSIF